MKDYCACWFRRVDQKFERGGIVYCANCNKPFCCAAVDLDHRETPHAAEIAYEEAFVCWRHWDSVADLQVTHSKLDPARV